MHRALFTDSKTGEFSSEIKLTNLVNGHPLVDIELNTHKFRERFSEHMNSSQKILNIDEHIAKAFNNIKLQSSKLYGIGDISNTTDPSFKPVVMNILTPVSSLFLISSVSRQLHEFCEIDRIELEKQPTFFKESPFIEALFDYCFSHEIASYIYLEKGPLDLLEVLYKTNQALKLLKNVNDKIEHLQEITSYFQFFNARKCHVGNPNIREDVEQYLLLLRDNFLELEQSKEFCIEDKKIIIKHHQYLCNHLLEHTSRTV